MLVNLLVLGALAGGAFLGWRRGALRIVAAFTALLLAGLLAMPLSGLGGLVVGGVPLALRPQAAVLAAGLLIFVGIEVLAEVGVRRWEKQRQDETRPDWLTWGGAVLGAAWGLCFFFIIMVGVDAISNADRVVADEDVSSNTTLRLLQDQLCASALAPLVNTVNPMNATARETLREVLSVVRSQKLMAEFRLNPKIQHLMANPNMIAISEDKEVQAAMAREDYATLLNSPKVAGLLVDSALFHEVLDADIPTIVKDLKKSEVSRERAR